jgi:hypothetical protein
MEELSFVIVDDHFNCGLSQWYDDNEWDWQLWVCWNEDRDFLLNEFLTLDNLVGLVREQLGWMDANFYVRLEGRIDLGSSNGPRMKMISTVCNEKEWTTYLGVVMKSEILAIELVATRVDWNIICDESSRSLMMPEAVDEQLIECAVVLTQPWQVLDDEGIADEPPFDGSNEVVHNVEPPLGSVRDVVDEAGRMAEVDPEPITAVVCSHEAPSIVPEYMVYDDAAFVDERAEGLDDDHPVPELSDWEKVLLQRALAEHAPDVPDCQDLSQSHRAVVDGFQFDDSVSH